MSSILIIGEATTTYGANKIIKQDSEKIVKSLYGPDCDLTKAFLLSKSAGPKNIYLANVKTKTAYVDILQASKQLNFTYIVPIGVRFSDKVYSKQLKRTLTYAEVFMRIITDYTESILVMTDNHASLYEDIDAYLDDMFLKINNFKFEADSILSNGRQLWLVANNLKDIAFSNVVLASLMCTTELPKYPRNITTEAVFNIDDTDVSNNELIYFKNNLYTNTSVENFINFHNESNAYKIAPIDMVIRKLNEDLDLSYFHGKLFSNQIKLKIKGVLQDYLTSQKGKLIRDFKIISIDYYLTAEHYYVIVNRFKILPMNSLEEVEVIIEV